MFVLEFKVKAKTQQYQAIDDAIRTAQFIRNKCVRLWMDTKVRVRTIYTDILKN